MVRECTPGLVATDACICPLPQPVWDCPLQLLVNSRCGHCVAFANVGVGDGKPHLWGPGSALLPGPPCAPVSRSLGLAGVFLWAVRARCAGELRTTVNAASLALGAPGQAGTRFASWGSGRRAVLSSLPAPGLGAGGMALWDSVLPCTSPGGVSAASQRSPRQRGVRAEGPALSWLQ